jgi:Fe-S-cluster containining protein
MAQITIDQGVVDAVAAGEYAIASEEIATLGPFAAYERSQERLDKRLASAPDAGTLACGGGCSWCCYFTVDVRAVEALRIVRIMRDRLTPGERDRVEREIRARSRELAGLDEMDRLQRNVKCPFLSRGRCTIYEARPQTCRNYHATNAAGCERSYEAPHDLDIDPDFAPLTYQIGGAHVEAFSRAMRDAGYDIAAYEMNAALAAALDQPDAERRFATKQPPFEGVPGSAPPFELTDADDAEESLRG